MIQEYSFAKDADDKEIMKDMHSEFPIICKKTAARQVRTSVPWHWHDALEIDLVTKGRILYRMPKTSFLLEEGDVLLVNSNVPHSTVFPEKTGEEEQLTLLFLPELIGGNAFSIFSRKYVRPFTEDRKTEGILLRRSDPPAKRLFEACDLFREEPFGYEMCVRNILSDAWLEITRDVVRNHDEDGRRTDQNNSKIKPMLAYISNHYGSKLTLEEIAGAANISTRECSRTFRRTIRESTMNYVTMYRLHMAQIMLLETNADVEQIAEKCGFSSSSYFIRVCREQTGMTPYRFRKKEGRTDG